MAQVRNAITKETGRKDDEVIEVGYDPEDDEMTATFSGMNL